MALTLTVRIDSQSNKANYIGRQHLAAYRRPIEITKHYIIKHWEYR